MATLTANVTATTTTWPLSAALASTTRYLLVDDELVAVITPATRDSQRDAFELECEVLRAVAGTQASHLSGATLTEYATLPLGAAEQTVYSRTTTLTDAQIKALPTTSIELVPAPGVGQAIMPMFALLLLDTTVNYYDNVAATAILQVDRLNPLDEAKMGAGATGSVSGLLQAGAPYYAVLLLKQIQPTVNTAHMYGSMGSSDDLQDAIFLRATNGAAGNFTQGHANNVMEVTLHYTVVDL
jgi:hypothetical protein